MTVFLSVFRINKKINIVINNKKNSIVLCYLTKFVKETFYSLFKLDICFHLYYSISRHSSDLCSKILRHGSAKERTWFYMKKTTKILSVFMALLMVVTCIPMTAFAQDRDTSSLDKQR